MGLFLGIPKRAQCPQDLSHTRLTKTSRGGRGQGLGQFALEFKDQALSGFLANARHTGEAGGVLQADGLGELIHREARQDCQPNPWANA